MVPTCLEENAANAFGDRERTLCVLNNWRI